MFSVDRETCSARRARSALSCSRLVCRSVSAASAATISAFVLALVEQVGHAGDRDLEAVRCARRGPRPRRSRPARAGRSVDRAERAQLVHGAVDRVDGSRMVSSAVPTSCAVAACSVRLSMRPPAFSVSATIGLGGLLRALDRHGDVAGLDDLTLVVDARRGGVGPASAGVGWPRRRRRPTRRRRRRRCPASSCTDWSALPLRVAGAAAGEQGAQGQDGGRCSAAPRWAVDRLR